ncbi:MAG: hypothetical protein H6Q90_2496 [Deltaproteobacteria bacterium]|nr:hypothetical protein [Deltaproteobacteria bacterium]
MADKSMQWLVTIAIVGCGSSTPPDQRELVDLTGVSPEFRPTATTISELIGLSYQLPDQTAPEATVVSPFALSALRQAGVRHARADLLWNLVEPTPGVRDFSTYRAKVEAYASAGVTTLPILAYGNAWANATQEWTTTPPDDPADYAAFAGAASTQFRGTIPTYEIWNEPNLGFRFWQPREQPDEYGTLLATASASIRAADPEASVMLGGLIEHGQLNKDAETFLELVYRSHPDIAKAYDVLAFHPYPLYPPAVAPELDDEASGEVATPRMVARLRALLAYYGDDPARPIWATELGWPTYGVVDEERQARWLVRGALLLAGSGVEKMYWYTLFDGPNATTFPPEDAFGLFHYDDPSDGSFAPTPKLAFTALSTLLSVAGPLAVTTDVTSELVGAPADAHAYRLVDPTGATPPVTVVWRADDAAPPIMVTVPVTRPSIRVVDLLGVELPASATIPLSGRPVYVVELP